MADHQFLSMTFNRRLSILGGAKAYLPERFAYKSYFEKNGYSVDLFNDFAEMRGKKFDIYWIFMGYDFKYFRKGKTIHEYQTIPVDSSSILRRLKGWLKRYLSRKPDYRVFKNKAVRDFYNFSDNIPFIYRDMGIPHFYFHSAQESKQYDFVYLGSMSKDRNIDILCDLFSNTYSDLSLLLIGGIPKHLEKYKSFPNLHFKGNLDQSEIPKLLNQCEYALHYIPNRFPFNVQLSTKLLEYAAVGLKIISTELAYLDGFIEKYGGSLFIIDERLKNFNIKKIKTFNFSTPDVSEFKWENVLDKSRILKLLDTINE